VGPAVGPPRPATHFRIALDRRPFVDGCGDAIMTLGFLAAVNSATMRLAKIPAPCSTPFPGLHPTGCTSRITAGGTAASSFVTLMRPNGVVWTTAVQAARSCLAYWLLPRARPPMLPWLRRRVA
jgi:hypothetical protein